MSFFSPPARMNFPLRVQPSCAACRTGQGRRGWMSTATDTYISCDSNYLGERGFHGDDSEYPSLCLFVSPSTLSTKVYRYLSSHPAYVRTVQHRRLSRSISIRSYIHMYTYKDRARQQRQTIPKGTELHSGDHCVCHPTTKDGCSHARHNDDDGPAKTRKRSSNTYIEHFPPP